MRLLSVYMCFDRLAEVTVFVFPFFGRIEIDIDVRTVGRAVFGVFDKVDEHQKGTCANYE